ncbi:hypothetical protein MMC26_006031 [Xylographa opegraphella]|nr:hypothetical protein [Xylographa opegraphella]
MTPSKKKQPLPSSKAVVVPNDHSASFTILRPALEEIRMLCLERHWESCIARCETLLENSHDSIHPMHKCYMHFFHALSHELLARSVSDLSVAKVPHLESSKQSYLAASSSLLLSSQLLKDEELEEHTLEETLFISGNTSPMSTPTRAPREPQNITGAQSSMRLPSPSWKPSPLNWVSASQASLANDPTFGSPLRKLLPLRIAPVWLSTSQVSLANDPDFCSPLRKPAPLRIVKRTSTLAAPPQKPDIHPNPPCTPLPTSSYQPRTPATVTFSEGTTTWLQDRATQRYSTYAAEFEPMLLRHVEVVDMLIESTMKVQADRYAGKRSASSNDDGEASGGERRARLERLKANGWTRERFRPERYQDLCARALAEL